MTYRAELGKDGSFQLNDVPPGEYTVTVQTSNEAAAPLVAKKYGSVKTTTLKATVKKGEENKFNFDVAK